MQQERSDERKVDNLLKEALELEEKGKYNRAIEIYENLITLDPSNPLARNKINIIHLIREGLKLRQKGDLDEAVKIFTQVLELDPDNVPAKSYRGLSYVGIDNDKADIDISEAIDKNPNDPRALIALSDFLCNVNEINKAIDAIDRASELEEGYDIAIKALILREKGAIANSLGRYILGASFLKESYQMNPEDLWTILWLAESKFSIDDYDGAILCYKKAIDQMSQKYWYTYHSLAIAYFTRGDYYQAVDAFNDALRLKPEDANIMCGKAFALSNIEKRYTESLQIFENVLKIDKNNIAARFGKMWVGQLANKEYQIQEKIKEVQTQLLTSSDSVICRTSEYLEFLLEDFRKGLNLVKNMFFVQFILGVSLLVAAVVAAFFDEDLVTVILGITGGASILIAFIREAPLQIQKNRVDFSQWMMGYFNWYNAFLETNIVLGQKVSSQKQITIKEMREIQDYLYNYTQNTIKLIEECCEFTKDSSKKEVLSVDKKIEAVPSQIPTHDQGTAQITLPQQTQNQDSAKDQKMA